jgi:hypothetical protein
MVMKRSVKMLNLTFSLKKMLIQLFSEKFWLKDVDSTFSLKNITTFSKKYGTFSSARAGRKIIIKKAV